jgi:hypothetical protein
MQPHQSWVEVLMNLAEIYDALILNFSGYGYQKRGVPYSLLFALEKIKRQHPSLKLLTIFHELYAFGPPWTSSFWLSWAQKHIATRLNRLSDIVITTTSRYRCTLERFLSNSEGTITVSPVFSNIGESSPDVCDKAREAVLLMFGGGEWVQRWIFNYSAEINRTCQELNLERIVIVGCDKLKTTSLNFPVEFQGVCNASAVQEWILRCKVAFMDYDVTSVVGKSTIYAAYAANGIPVVFPRDPKCGADGLLPGIHFLLSQSLAGKELSLVAVNAHLWYQSHTVQRTALSFLNLLSTGS